MANTYTNISFSDININTIDQKTVHGRGSDDFDAVNKRRQELELHSDDYDAIKRNKQEVELQSDDYDSVPGTRQNELNNASDYVQSTYTGNVTNRQRKFTARRKVIYAVVIALTVVVIATIIVVIVVTTTTAEKVSDIDYCVSSPCGNGTCINDVTRYRCLCSDGFNGTSCEQNINECASQPCFNGSCNDLVDGYKCSCYVGYSGKNCQEQVTDNGTCIDGVNNKRCSCSDEFNGTGCEHILTDCIDILLYDGNSTDGVYTIQTWRTQRLLDVYCDMTTDGGGWTVFQNRFDGSIDFYRNFSEYDYGFGNLSTEFWLGLSYIEEIANQNETDLRIDLESANGTKAFETFEKFYLSPGPAYTLHLGPTIDSFIVTGDSRFSHNGANFSTYDHDADTSPTSNAAVNFQGAWWYKSAYTMNLNGRYMTPGTRTGKGMVYNGFLTSIALKSSKMMMRRRVK